MNASASLRFALVAVVGPDAPGSASLANGTYTTTGAGTDIWNASDPFHYVYANATGDTSISARATTVQNINKWSKAGVMIRNGTAANAAFADVFIEQSRRRLADLARVLRRSIRVKQTPQFSEF